MFYGSDTHAESAAAIFSVVASCRLHSLDPELGRFPDYVDLWSRLIKLRRNFDNHTRGLRGGNTNIFWVNDSDGILAYHRRD
jgi:hypothetical protein